MAKARTLVLNTKVNVTGADKLRGLGKTLQKTGGLLTAGLTLPLVGVGAAMLTAAQDAERAQAKLSNTFKSMGAAAFTSVKALNAHAQALQDATTFDDESINEAQAVLLTFGKVTGDAFTRATEAALDMTALFDGDLQAATLQIGKALNDPIKGITALTRVGVSFTQQQKDQIKVLAESGDLLGAQTIILAELERQFGGTAEALAGTAGGQMTQALNQLGEASEEFGKIIAPMLLDVAKGLKDFAKWLRQLNPETKEWVLRIGLLAAALGPVLIVVGTLVRTFKGLKAAFLGLKAGGAFIISLAPRIGLAFHAMLGPIGILTAAISLLAAGFATDFLGMRTRFEKDMADIGGFLGDAGDAFRDFFGVVDKGTGIELPKITGSLDDEMEMVTNSVTFHMQRMADEAAEIAKGERIRANWKATTDYLPQAVRDRWAATRTAAFQQQVEYAKGLLDAQNNVKVAIEAALQVVEDEMTKQEEIAYLSGQRGTLMLARGIAKQEGKDASVAAIDGALALLRERLGDLGVEFYNSGYSLVTELARGMLAGNASTKSPARAAYTVATGIGANLRIESEPKEGPLRGITKWGGNMATTLAEGALRELSRLRAVGVAMAGALAPSFGAMTPAFAGGSSGGALRGGGGTTNIYNNFTFSGTPSGSKNELSSLLRDLSAVSGGDVRYG